jgi:hypothetical protein
MIIKEQVMPHLLRACPSFAEPWKEHRAYYGDDDLLYIALGKFARHIIDLYKKNQTEEFAVVFDTIELLHLEGDQYVREAATIGLLEGIQNNAGHNGVDPEVFDEYLGTETEKWWRQLNDFWDGKIPYVGATINDA